MAMSKTGGASKDKAAPKKAAPRRQPRRLRRRSKPAAKTTVKKAPPKKAAGPKLTPPQMSLLEAIAKVTQPTGYVAAKKPDQKVVDTLLRHKLVKKGKKDEKTKSFFVSISLAGRKFLGTTVGPGRKA